MDLNKYIETKNQIIESFIKHEYIFFDDTLLNITTKLIMGREVITRSKISFKQHPMLFDNEVYAEYTYSVYDTIDKEEVFETLTVIPVEMNEDSVNELKEIAGIN